MIHKPLNIHLSLHLTKIKLYEKNPLKLCQNFVTFFLSYTETTYHTHTHTVQEYNSYIYSSFSLLSLLLLCPKNFNFHHLTWLLKLFSSYMPLILKPYLLFSVWWTLVCYFCKAKNYTNLFLSVIFQKTIIFQVYFNIKVFLSSIKSWIYQYDKYKSLCCKPPWDI